MGSTGEIMTCAHCAGSGDCCCHGCLKEAGLDPESDACARCSACGGKGSVWVGPNHITIKE
jgi:hypothetical protein